MGKISGPVMERLDLCVHVQRVDYSQLAKVSFEVCDGPWEGAVVSRNSAEEGGGRFMDSRHMQENIERIYEIQAERFQGMGIRYNSEMQGSVLEKFCKLDRETQSFLEKVYDKCHLSARVYQQILKVARTIADLGA